jgi:phospholipid/cholesterol/gamma-HCH transport system substrate-binding protein
VRLQPARCVFAEWFVSGRGSRNSSDVTGPLRRREGALVTAVLLVSAGQKLVMYGSAASSRACTTGLLPGQQQRAPTFQDYPGRPAGDVYCRIPQDAPFNVRGARNLPCVTVPGKRAPTAKMCQSNENYVALNDGYSWKGDPNATLSGQPVPQLPPGSQPAQAPPPPGPAPPSIAAAEYDPATGTYVGPDGRVYTQSNLARSATEERTWQTMLLPPTGN